MINEGFIKYLCQLGILDGQIKSSKNVLFAIADHFKTLGPSDAYDMSVRLMKNYQNQKKQLVPSTPSIRLLVLALKAPTNRVLSQAVKSIQCRQNSQSWKFDNQFNSPEKNYPSNSQPHLQLSRSARNFNSNQSLQPSEHSIRLKGSRNLKKEFQQIHQSLYQGSITQHEAQILLGDIKDQYNKECTFKPQIHKSPAQKSMKRSNSSADNRIHDRLYQNGMEKQLNLIKFQELKRESEMKNCSFRPQVSAPTDFNRVCMADQVFDRLHRTRLVGKEDYGDLKFKEEVKDCTFQPQISIKNSLQQQEDVSCFDRLYREADARSKVQGINEIVKENIVLQHCTFQPLINTNEVSRDVDASYSMNKEEVYERLHRVNEEKQRQLMCRQIEKERQEVDSCSFRPHINKVFFDENIMPSIPAHERLYQQMKINGNNTNQGNNRNSKSKDRIIPTSKRNNHKSPLRDTNQEQPSNLLQRMKEFAEKKKKHVAQLAVQIQQEQGITFNPKINARQPRSHLSPHSDRSRSRSVNGMLINQTKLNTSNFNTSNFNTSKLNTSKLNTSKLNTSKLNTSTQSKSKPSKSPSSMISQFSRKKQESDPSSYCETAFFQGSQENIKQFNTQGNNKRQEVYSLEQRLLQNMDQQSKEKYLSLQI